MRKNPDKPLDNYGVIIDCWVLEEGKAGSVVCPQ